MCSICLLAGVVCSGRLVLPLLSGSFRIHRHVRVALRFRVLLYEASKDSSLPISRRRRMPPMILVPRDSAYFVCVLHLNETLELFDCI